MTFEQKYLKYKNKYINLKHNQYGAGHETIHIYNGGSFSPPTKAHEKICIDTFNFFMNYLKDSNIDTIILHLVPTTDMYDKSSVKSECIPYNTRVEMLKIITQNIIEKIVLIHKAYKLRIIVDEIEQKIAYEPKNDNSEDKKGFIGTYNYLEEFAKLNKCKSEKSS